MRAPHALARHKPPVTALAAAVAVCAALTGDVASAAPPVGVFTGGPTQLEVAPTKTGLPPTVSASLRIELACDDGTRLVRNLLLPRTTVGRNGGFAVKFWTGANYGPDGRIGMAVALKGRFLSGRRASGWFMAGAVVQKREFDPAASCASGRVEWTARRNSPPAAQSKKRG